MAIKRKKYNSEILKALCNKHKVEEHFARLAIRGERKSPKAVLIQSEYNSYLNSLNQLLDNNNQA